MLWGRAQAILKKDTKHAVLFPSRYKITTKHDQSRMTLNELTHVIDDVVYM